jgi:hypothetical protein
MNDHRQEILARGLQEFDRSVSKRRTRRCIAGAAVAILLTIVVGMSALALRGGPNAAPREIAATNHRPLPIYVQIIHDDDHLIAELELAQACERIDRKNDRVYVVECTTRNSQRMFR